MTLPELILDLQGFFNGDHLAPPNEASTCDWIISPLLIGSGYHLRDILSQGVNPTGKIPDYTILSSTPHTWFLEAKKWSDPLSDLHADQALNYAHSSSNRWVVLSNGKEWRLYDDNISGISADRLILKANLSDFDEIEEFMRVIGKSSITTNAIEKSVLQLRLKSTLKSEFLNPNSDLIKAMRSSLRSDYKLSGVQGADIVLALQPTKIPGGSPSLPTPHSPLPPVIANVTAVPHTGINSTYTLKDLADMKQNIAGMKPILVKFSSGKVDSVKSWIDLAVKIIAHIASSNFSLPIPFSGQASGKRYLINSSPIHVNGDKMNESKILSFPTGVVYLHTNRSSSDLVSSLHSLCIAVGLDPNQITVHF